MYNKTEKKSITDLLKELESEKPICIKDAEIALRASTLEIDKKIGIEKNMTLMMHVTSLSKHDVETKTWDKLDISDPKVKEFAKVVRAWSPDDPMGLFIYGIPGNAKTHMIKCLIVHHSAPNYRFYFTTVSDFMTKCKDYVRMYYHAKDYIDMLVRDYHAIVLDDLGTEKASDFEQGELFDLLESIKRNNKRVFMTSNLTLEQLKEKYQDRIVSRFGEFMCAINNPCDSYRKKIHQNNLLMYKEKVKILPRN